MIKTLLKPLSFLPALMLMYMIYSFSAQPGEVSSELSYKVSYKIVQTADYIFDGGHEEWQLSQWAGKINFITRKLAHMTEYFALAVAVSFPLYVYGLHGFLLMLVAGIICVGFACGDEYHQSFVSGRSPGAKDVCIDSFGAFWGIILVRIIGWTGRNTIFCHRKKKKNSQPYPEEAFYKSQEGYTPRDGYVSQNGYGSGPQQTGYRIPQARRTPRYDNSPENPYGSHYTRSPQGGYANGNGTGNDYHPENGGYSPKENHGLQDPYYAPENSCGPQNGYRRQDDSPQEDDYGPDAPVKKKKKEKDWIFDDFV